MPSLPQTQILPHLHDLPDFQALLLATAQATGILSQQVEKDYWLMHCLYGLKQCGLVFDLKGGTSLSKGYRIIQRFSEDIDIRIEPTPGLPIKSTQTRDSHIEKRQTFFASLLPQIQVPGIIQVKRDSAFDDPYLRGVGIRLLYPTLFVELPALKEGILLEVGFDDTEPNTPCTISSWAFDQAERSGLQAGKDFINNRAVSIPCYHPGFTFVEKLQAVSTKYRLERSGSGLMPSNFLRHYYDLYALLEVPQVQAFIGTESYHARKKVRFRQGDNLNIAENEAFSLSDPIVFKRYEEEYQRIADIFYTDPPTLKAILARITAHQDRL